MGKRGYYSEGSGNKWVTTKTNTTNIKKLTHKETDSLKEGLDSHPWITLNESSMTSVG